jgi:hypothetical protein
MHGEAASLSLAGLCALPSKRRAARDEGELGLYRPLTRHSVTLLAKCLASSHLEALVAWRHEMKTDGCR